MSQSAQPLGRVKIVSFGELLLRLASPAPSLLFQQPQLIATFCGAEANVSAGLAGLGHDARLVTRLPNNALGSAAKAFFAGEGVDVIGPVASEGRLGLYFLQPGAMNRPASIVYDRAGSSFASSSDQDYRWKNLLEGADWLVVSGITAALGDGPLAALRGAMTSARMMGVNIAFDTNFRPALWEGRQTQAAEILHELSCQSDLLFAGRRAIAMMLGTSFKEHNPDKAFHAAAKAMFEAAPGIRHVAATRREVFSSDSQSITALIASREDYSVSDTIRLDNIVDRVGTGDAFAAGVIHGLVVGMPLDRIASFSLACSTWAHSIPGDLMRATLADIEALEAGGRDIRR